MSLPTTQGNISPVTSNVFETLLDKPGNLQSMVQGENKVKLKWTPIQARGYSYDISLGPAPKSCGKFSTEIL